MTGVVIKSTGPLVLGGLVSQLWPLHDAGTEPETDLLTAAVRQCQTRHGWAISFSPLMTANWDAEDGNEWTVPLRMGLTRTMVFNRRPMNLGVNYYYNVERPAGAAGQQLRFVVSLLYPR